MKERVAQSMHKMTIYARRKLHQAGQIAWEMRWKRGRHVCKSQNVYPLTINSHTGVHTASWGVPTIPSMYAKHQQHKKMWRG